MSAAENKRLVREAYEALGRGETGPYLDLLADDFTFTVTGHNPWSGTFQGKETVRRELYAHVFGQFADRYTAQLVDIVAEGDMVVVEYHGCVTTKRGDLYNNQYCLVCRMRDGKLVSAKEYADTLLVDRVLDPPPWAKSKAKAAVEA